MQDHRKLEVWKKAHAVASAVHRLTQPFSRLDGYLKSQIRRAALSVPANIAEGCGRRTNRDFAKFLQIAIGSTVELEYHLEFSTEVGLLDRTEFLTHQRSIVEVRKMLVGLEKRVRSTQVKSKGAVATDHA